MKTKTSLYLDEADRARLKRLARQLELSEAEVMRRALAVYDEQRAPRRRFAVDGAGASSDGRSVADIPEEELLEGFGED